MKLYKFTELNNAAKNNAIESYIEGWNETHDKDDLEYSEVESILINNCTDLYNDKGQYITDGTT